MNCPNCREKMENIGPVHRWHETIWLCEECDVEVPEDITGDLIDHAKDIMEDAQLQGGSDGE